MFGGAGGSSALGFDQGKAMEASFREFLARPENRKLVEKQQRKEVRQAIAAQDRARVLEFKERLLASSLESQANVARYLRTPVLRRIVQTFSNDEGGDFEKWAENPRVLEMLGTAERLLKEGSVTEEEVERMLVRQLEDPRHEGHADFAAATKRVARLPTDALVGALNEHLEERRKGNDAYRERRWADAAESYARADAVVEAVEALSSADAAELDACRVAVRLNLSALALSRGEPREAERQATRALELRPDSDKGLARRAKARGLLGDAAGAERDLASLSRVDHWLAVDTRAEVERGAAERERRQRAELRGMFDRAKVGSA